MAVVLSHPDILGGTPCFAGTRVPAATLFEYLGRGHTVDYFLKQFPAVTRDQALELLRMAGRGVGELSRSDVPPARKAAG